jgi:hypothetical protein
MGEWNEGEIEKVFGICDGDGDGLITVAELRSLFETFTEGNDVNNLGMFLCCVCVCNVCNVLFDEETSCMLNFLNMLLYVVHHALSIAYLLCICFFVVSEFLACIDNGDTPNYISFAQFLKVCIMFFHLEGCCLFIPLPFIYYVISQGVQRLQRNRTQFSFSTSLSRSSSGVSVCSFHTYKTFQY